MRDDEGAQRLDKLDEFRDPDLSNEGTNPIDCDGVRNGTS